MFPRTRFCRYVSADSPRRYVPKRASAIQDIKIVSSCHVETVVLLTPETDQEIVIRLTEMFVSIDFDPATPDIPPLPPGRNKAIRITFVNLE